MEGTGLSGLLSRLDIVPDTLTVRKVFGEPYRVDDVTVIPVAAVRGGGGAGGGQGWAPTDQGGGGGGGMGFGVNARPVGVYVVKDGDVQWRPAIDVVQLVLGGQLAALTGIVMLRRRRHRKARLARRLRSQPT